ncbi:MFS transporter [Bacillus sp. SH7-1]|uniref:MFS transporter n=1 Tax=Bacillus sp. SH7-1 TaxID=2217818 RepID=UPI0011C7877F|nr:MFS transporter [Bacillus sp. SH7-1]TXS00991.1 MFS transporter [Bacillus sp. SH7-1]
MDIYNRKKLSLALVLFNLFIVFLGIGLVVPIMPTYMKTLQLGTDIMGYLIATFAFFQLLISPISGIWVDIFGRKKMIIIGLIIFSFSEFLFGFGNQIWVLFLSRALGGISAACMMPAVTAFIADTTSLENRAKALGYLSAAISTGFIIGPGIGGFISDFGIRAPFFFAAVISGIAACFSVFILKEPVSKEQRIKMRDNKTQISFVNEMKQSFHPVYFIPLVLVFVLGCGLSAYEHMFSFVVDKKFGFTPKDISTIISISAILGVIAQILFFDKLVKRFGEKRIIQGSLFIAAIFIFVSTFTSHYGGIMIVTFVTFLACDLLRPAITTLLSKIAGENQGFAGGMNSTYTSLGNIVGPATGGVLLNVNVNLPYIFAGVILIIGFCITVFWSKYITVNNNNYNNNNIKVSI